MTAQKIKNCNITLEEALVDCTHDFVSSYSLEYRQNLAQLIRDPVHVRLYYALLVNSLVFGCENNIAGYLENIFWILCGSDLDRREIKNIISGFFLEIKLRKLSYLKLLPILFSSLPKLWAIYLKSQKMNKKWSFFSYWNVIDKPLSEIRLMWNIVS